MFVRPSASQPTLSQEFGLPAVIEDLRNPLRPRRWERGRFLGKGGFAKVYEARDLSTGELQAVKVVELASIARAKARAKLSSEIAIHRTLDSPHVVKYITHFEDSSNVYIFLELCPHESLNELLRAKKRLSESECAHYMTQLLQGLVYLKRQRVIHRDLKLGNLFIGRHSQLKIGDMGLAAKLDFEHQKRLTVCGTPNYIAPEILDLNAAISTHAAPVSASTASASAFNRQAATAAGGAPRGGHSFPVDVWSVGVIMFTLLTGRPPFEDVDIKHTYQRIRENRYAFPDSVYLSGEVRALIKSMLRTNPADRPAVEDLARHPWFASASASREPVAGLSASVSVARREIREVRQEQRPATLASERNSGGLLGSASMNFLPASPAAAAAGAGTGAGWTVSRWLDYSSKYGMGVVLENRRASRKFLAVYFNDSTKMYADLENFRSAVYVVRSRSAAEQKYTLPISDQQSPAPGSLQGLLAGQENDVKKKLTLLRNFRSYLLTDTPKEGTERGKSCLALGVGETRNFQVEEEVHLRKYFRTRQALVFVLSNKTHHVMFMDTTGDEVLLRGAGSGASLEITIASPRLGVPRNFRSTHEIRDERIRHRVEQAIIVVNNVTAASAVHHQPHGG